jgi:hypothetical protein
MAEMRVYFSYAHPDEGAARRIAELLERQSAGRLVAVGHWDQLPAGQTWAISEQREIKSADVVIALLSESSVASDYVRVETELAITEGKPLIPVLIQGISGQVPWVFPARAWLDLRHWDGESTDAELASLVDQLEVR